ncbi:PCMD domain-containing protein [uncultured Parabacteroides sp.]|uniref:PCMD domain-containing protein n=1 Tax=uncultured Parabacteroides sp. TaxID=512312 RepID=UPI0025CBF92D|nr:PCMD domain-containing protein [uncultured Parabacteroides sp.]
MRRTFLITCLLLGLILVSCIRDEAPNAEADILTCIVPDDILKRDPVIENNKVTLMVRADIDLKHQAPEFTLTPGATISPASGTERDFTTPQYYTVRSEDGNWTKEYQVSYIIAGISTEYHFENVDSVVRTNYTYDVFYLDDANSNRLTWANGNSGFAITGAGTKDPASFPTSSLKEGKVGKGVRLETKSTGKFGMDVEMPIAAGNLFMGTFDMLSALTNALKATRLGMPFEHVPVYLKGYYKYKAGETFEEKGKPVPNKKDTWDVYAIFYEVTDDVRYLDGTIVEGNYTHPNLISVALLDDKDRKETDEWTEFYIPFVMKPGKTIDREKLKAGGYNVSIVFSSSKEGNYFRGAPGSTLLIDEVELIYAVDN